MLKNYLKTAFRSLVKNKTHSFINIFGLSVGMAVALLIALWIWDELSFDHYHTNQDRLAQVMDTKTFNDETTTSEDVAIPLADELRNKYAADFKHVALVFHNYTHVLGVGDKKISASGVWTERDLPEMLTLKMLKGKRDALKDPSSVLLAQSLAKALFGNADPMNKAIRLDNMAEVKVGGVFEDLPENTSFYDTKIFLSWDKALTVLTWLKDFKTQWETHNWRIFVQLNDQVDMNKATAKIKNIPQQYVKDGKEEILLHPMDKWHLYSEFRNGKIAGGRIRYAWMFSIIGAFVLLLACINFMNLSTAKSEKRAKEVGIRKAVGSLRGQLISQFLGESLLVTGIAFLLSLLIVQLCIPSFNRLADKTISIPFLNPAFGVITLGFTLITGLIAGSYPAFYLSSFNPVKVLKGTFKAGRFASFPRKALVVVQFTVSIALIIGTLIVFRQIQFAKNRPVGYTREGLITILMNTPELYKAPYNILRNELQQTGAVEDMAESDNSPTNAPFPIKGFDWKGIKPGSVPQLGVSIVTHDFGKTVGWEIKSGRDFSRSFVTDSGSVILNESAAKLMGLANPVGEIIKWDGEPHVITGVVKDMVMESPYKPVQPTIFYMMYYGNVIILRIKPTVPLRAALTKIEQVFKKYNPAGAFEYKFIDEEYARKFSDEERIGNLATVFAILAIFISCLGLFGLASYVAEQRTKEIGIRKVLGASVFNLWKMLSKDFVLLVMLSCVIAIPVAYYFLHQWLLSYEYRTPVSWWIFAAAGIGAFVITLLTVSYQSIKAALANPVKSLKTE
jgi:putative ABC transport system permease protein